MRIRTLILITILVLLAGMLGFVLFRYAVMAQSPGDEWIPPRSIPNTDVNPYGANFFSGPRGRDVEARADG